MFISLTDLRANLYNRIDHLIATGEAIEIKRKGHIVKIIPVTSCSKLSRIIRREDVISNCSDELINNNWLEKWDMENGFS